MKEKRADFIFNWKPQSNYDHAQDMFKSDLDALLKEVAKAAWQMGANYYYVSMHPEENDTPQDFETYWNQLNH